MKYRILPAKPRLFSDALVLPEEPLLIIADSHCPYQNADMLHKAFAIAKKRKVKALLHAGDLIDGAEYNSQAKNETNYPIADEINAAKSIIDTATQWFDKLYFLPGNHDQFYLRKNKVSFEMLVKDIIDNNQHTNLIITEYDYCFYGTFCVIGHPSNYAVVPGELAAGLADKYGMHCIVGHDHMRGIKKSEKGYLGISLGGTFVQDHFWYKQRSFNLFPESDLGFVIIKNREIWLYNEEAKGTRIV